MGKKLKKKTLEQRLIRCELILADDEKIVIKTEFGEETIKYDNILAAATYLNGKSIIDKKTFTLLIYFNTTIKTTLYILLLKIQSE